MAKLPTVVRPEIEIEYSGTAGFLYVLLCIVKVGIRRATIDITLCGETVAKRKLLVVPKWTIKRAR